MVLETLDKIITSLEELGIVKEVIDPKYFRPTIAFSYYVFTGSITTRGSIVQDSVVEIYGVIKMVKQDRSELKNLIIKTVKNLNKNNLIPDGGLEIDFSPDIFFSRFIEVPMVYPHTGFKITMINNDRVNLLHEKIT